MLGALVALVALAGVPSHKADPKKAAALELVKAELKDPSSAQFKGVKALTDKGDYCGWVNAKNSYGGYTGFTVFYVYGEKVILLTPETSAPTLCK